MNNSVKKLGVMLDCSRDAVYNVKTLKNYIGLLAKMGYNTLQLYTEDTYTIDDPYFGYLRGRYTPEELRELDKYATEQGIELVPCIQTLAHLSGYLRWNPDVVDCNDILLADYEPTYELIDKMFAACAECFTSRRINIGMDEAHMVGLGTYLDRHGFENRFDILNRHLKKVVEIAEKYGFAPMMWSDMFFRLANNGEYDCNEGDVIPQEVIDLVPENLQLVYWDYYSTKKSRYDKMLKAHKQFKNEIVFAGGAWSWSGFVPLNEFSTVAHDAAIRSCLEQDIEEVIVTSWKDDGAECSLYSSLPCLFFTAKMVQGIFDRDILEAEFEQFFGTPYSIFRALEAAELADPVGLANPCKYMLYSDPFVGFLDWTVNPDKVCKIKNAYEIVKNAPRGEYGYIFDTFTALMEIMSRKYSLGYELRKAYKAGDMEALSKLAIDCEVCANGVKKLQKSFFAQWMKECKPYGFEKHTTRLGGLSARLIDCSERIKAYLNGDVDEIPELDEEILPFKKGLPAGEPICQLRWLNTAAVKPQM